MTNQQWLMWQLIDMTAEALVKEFPGFMCDVCYSNHFVPSDEPCNVDCDKRLLAWLQQEHNENY